MNEQAACITRPEFVGRNALCDERFGRDKERLDAYETGLQEVQKLSVQMGEMIKRHDSQIENHEQRLASIEKQPADQYGKVKMAVVTAVISVMVSGIMTAVMAAMK
jgi:hypothetical protein